MLSDGEKKTVYMIRRKSDGLFSSGGMSPAFRKTGKVWSTLGHLKLHLNMFVGIAYNSGYSWHQHGHNVQPQTVSISSFYDGCEIVELEQVVTTKTSEVDLNALLTDRAEKELVDQKSRDDRYVLQDYRGSQS